MLFAAKGLLLGLAHGMCRRTTMLCNDMCCIGHAGKFSAAVAVQPADVEQRGAAAASRVQCATLRL